MKKRALFIKFSKSSRDIEVSYDLKMCIRLAVKTTLEHEDFPFDSEVSVTFCDNEYIKNLNSLHRGMDRSTDVLSFPMYEGGDFDVIECISGALLGDIVISLERAREQALEYGNSFLREATFLAVHSTLHLLGYDHERSEDDDEIQCEKQRQIMKKIENEVNLDD